LAGVQQDRKLLPAQYYPRWASSWIFNAYVLLVSTATSGNHDLMDRVRISMCSVGVYTPVGIFIRWPVITVWDFGFAECLPFWYGIHCDMVTTVWVDLHTVVILGKGDERSSFRGQAIEFPWSRSHRPWRRLRVSTHVFGIV
jgi:hypothetical protein